MLGLEVTAARPSVVQLLLGAGAELEPGKEIPLSLRLRGALPKLTTSIQNLCT